MRTFLHHWFGIPTKPGKGPFVFAQHQRRELLMIKPTTGMNLSGIAVKDVANRWDLLSSDIHVVVDDVDLPLGTIRIRPNITFPPTDGRIRTLLLQEISEYELRKSYRNVTAYIIQVIYIVK